MTSNPPPVQQVGGAVLVQGRRHWTNSPNVFSRRYARRSATATQSSPTRSCSAPSTRARGLSVERTRIGELRCG